MNRLSLMAVATAVLAAGVGGTQAVLASEDHAPADKAVAGGSKLEVMGPGVEKQILRATLKTAKPTDLVLQVAMECSIFTRLITGPSGAEATDSATATGTVRAWVEVDGKIVPITSVSNPPQTTPPGGDDSDKVTFCNRTYRRKVTDAENPLDGQDIEDDFIDTKSANAFNWLRLNVGSGSHTVVVKATLTEEAEGDATAEAVIGNRTLIVEPTKLANDATIE